MSKCGIGGTIEKQLRRPITATCPSSPEKGWNERNNNDQVKHKCRYMPKERLKNNGFGSFHLCTFHNFESKKLIIYMFSAMSSPAWPFFKKHRDGLKGFIAQSLVHHLQVASFGSLWKGDLHNASRHHDCYQRNCKLIDRDEQEWQIQASQTTKILLKLHLPLKSIQENKNMKTNHESSKICFPKPAG